MDDSIPEFDVESLAVSRDTVTHAAPDDRERTPASTTSVGPVGRIGESEVDVRVAVASGHHGVTDENEIVGSGRTNGVVAL